MGKKCLKILSFFNCRKQSYGLYLQGARPSRDRCNNSAIVTHYCKHHWKLFCLSYHSQEQRHEVSAGIPKLSATFCWGVFEQLARYTMRYQEFDLHLDLNSSLTSANNINLPTLLTLFYFSTLLYLLVQIK